MQARPLTTRIFKIKNPATKFYCPLCRTERAFIYHPHLSSKHYVQIFMTSVILVLLTFPIMGYGSFASFFLVWGIFEMAVRLLFRQEVPCPHCGFDASWYKRDVKVAKRRVQEFWAQKNNAPNQTPISEQAS